MLFVLITSLAACSKSEKSTIRKATQKTFASPADAGAALVQAAKSGDHAALLANLRSGFPRAFCSREMR